MARSAKKLSAIQVKNLSKTGRHADGEGLYLNIARGGSKSWVFLWMKDRRRREMGLGPYPSVSLSEARERADVARKVVAAGGDPLSQRDTEAPKSFGEVADLFLESMEGSWKNQKHREQWRYTLSRKRAEDDSLVRDGYCLNLIDLPVAAVDTNDVLKALTPIWQEKAETASRLRGRIERVLDYAKVKGWREGENPALWRGHLKNALPTRAKLQRGHHAAMPYADVPNFFASLKQREAVSADGLAFLLLTASRSGEVINAKWPEVDFEREVWTVPPDRMKAGKEHRVPLSPPAVEILKRMLEIRDSDWIFPGAKRDRPQSPMAFTMLLRRMELGHFTPHGFRSSFRDWVGDETTFPRELAEAALAHTVGDETERAYRRSDALARRRKLMEAWASYCTSRDNVTALPHQGELQATRGQTGRG